jgi:hypothetical protein
MKRVVVGALAAAILLCAGGSAVAQSPPPTASTPKRFTSVDAVSVQSIFVIVTGVVEGETVPSTWAARPYTSDGGQFADTCSRHALLAMAKPGQYLLEINSGSTSVYATCKLIRVSP